MKVGRYESMKVERYEMYESMKVGKYDGAEV
jgi:hypothetical protein